MSEVLDHAPADISAPERLLLVVLAEAADTNSRQCYPGPDRLSHRMGMSWSGVKQIMQRLAGRGIEVRVQFGTDSFGRPVFARKGKKTTYQIPKFPTTLGDSSKPPKSSPKGDSSKPPKDTVRGLETVSKGDYLRGLNSAPLTKNSMNQERNQTPYTAPTPSTRENPDENPPENLDLFGDPIEPPNPVPLVVAGYIDSVRETGGVATSAMCGAIGKNAKRLIETDKIPPAVVLVAAQRAGAKRAKTLDQFLGDAQQTYDRGGQSRRAMFDHWRRLHDQAATAQPELGA